MLDYGEDYWVTMAKRGGIFKVVSRGSALNGLIRLSRRE